MQAKNTILVYAALAVKTFMRITKLQKLIILFRIIGATTYESILLLLGSIFSSKKRSYMDKRVHIWNQKLLKIARVNYRVFNPHNFEFKKDRPYIIMSNHASHYDIPLIYATFPGASIRMIAKKELFLIPIFGWGIKIGECVAIDRENPRQAIKDLARAKQKILSGIKLWIAPEGTRSRTGKMGVFKKGGFKIAIDVGAIIVPVAIIGSSKILPAKTYDLSLNENVEMHVCKPIDTLEYKNNLPKLMADVENEIKTIYGD